MKSEDLKDVKLSKKMASISIKLKKTYLSQNPRMSKLEPEKTRMLNIDQVQLLVITQMSI